MHTKQLYRSIFTQRLSAKDDPQNRKMMTTIDKRLHSVNSSLLIRIVAKSIYEK